MRLILQKPLQVLLLICVMNYLNISGAL